MNSYNDARAEWHCLMPKARQPLPKGTICNLKLAKSSNFDCAKKKNQTTIFENKKLKCVEFRQRKH